LPAARKLTLGRLERYYENNVTPLVRETHCGLFAPVYFADIKKLAKHLPRQPYFNFSSMRRGADLGSGDGRVVMALAAQDYFASVTGYELDDELFAFSSRVHRDFGDADGIEFKKEDFLNTDFSSFDFYFYYAKTTDPVLLGEKLAREAPVGALVVIYQYQLDGLYAFLKDNGFVVVERIRIPYFSVVDGEVATSFAVLQKAALDAPSGLSSLSGLRPWKILFYLCRATNISRTPTTTKTILLIPGDAVAFPIWSPRPCRRRHLMSCALERGARSFLSVRPRGPSVRWPNGGDC
jgi:hypothetical protein